MVQPIFPLCLGSLRLADRLGRNHYYAASQALVPNLIPNFPNQLGRLPTAKPRPVFMGVIQCGTGSPVKEGIGAIERTVVLMVAFHCRSILYPGWLLNRKTGQAAGGRFTLCRKAAEFGY